MLYRLVSTRAHRLASWRDGEGKLHRGDAVKVGEQLVDSAFMARLDSRADQRALVRAVVHGSGKAAREQVINPKGSFTIYLPESRFERFDEPTAPPPPPPAEVTIEVEITPAVMTAEEIRAAVQPALDAAVEAEKRDLEARYPAEFATGEADGELPPGPAEPALIDPATLGDEPATVTSIEPEEGDEPEPEAQADALATPSTPKPYSRKRGHGAKRGS